MEYDKEKAQEMHKNVERLANIMIMPDATQEDHDKFRDAWKEFIDYTGRHNNTHKLIDNRGNISIISHEKACRDLCDDWNKSMKRIEMDKELQYRVEETTDIEKERYDIYGNPVDEKWETPIKEEKLNDK